MVGLKGWGGEDSDAGRSDGEHLPVQRITLISFR